MEQRTKLIEARGSRTREEVSRGIGCSEDSLANWEKGITNPQYHWRNKLCTFYGRDPAELDLDSGTPNIKLEDIIKMLERYDRREIIAALQSSLPIFAGLDLFTLLESPNIAPEEFLDQCNAGINACWHLIKHDGLAYASKILNTCVPKLALMANHNAPYQQIAASLAAEAKIQQTILAAHNLDYRERGIHSMAAIRFGKLSGDGRIHAVAVSWLADMYTSSWNRYPQPQKAISLFLDGLAELDSGAYLNRADLSIGLAKAYALSGNQTKARDMIEQARTFMPEHPEQDPIYQIVEFGQSELDQQEGRIYLELDRTFPDQRYSQMAFDTFDRSAGKQILSDRVRSNLLIYKADAARVIKKDFDEFVRCLEDGTLIAFQIDSKKRQKEARRILDKVPETWKKEPQYQQLVKMF